MKIMNEVATKEQDVIFPPTISNREYAIVIACSNLPLRDWNCKHPHEKVDRLKFLQ